MNTIILMLLLSCGLASNKDLPVNSIWKLIESGKNIKEEKHFLDSDGAVLIPFYWKKVKYSALDSMLDKGRSRDSLLELYSSGDIDFPPDPINTKIGKLIIGYSSKRIVELDSCKYEVRIFYAAEREELISHYSVRFYYIRDFGIISAVFVEKGKPTFEWNRYVLTDLKNKMGTSILNKKLIEAINEKWSSW